MGARVVAPKRKESARKKGSPDVKTDLFPVMMLGAVLFVALFAVLFIGNIFGSTDTKLPTFTGKAYETAEDVPVGFAPPIDYIVDATTPYLTAQASGSNVVISVKQDTGVERQFVYKTGYFTKKSTTGTTKVWKQFNFSNSTYGNSNWILGKASGEFTVGTAPTTASEEYVIVFVCRKYADDDNYYCGPTLGMAPEDKNWTIQNFTFGGGQSCTNECTAGAYRCNTTTTRNPCQLNATSGCYQWMPVESCPSQTPTCDTGVCVTAAPSCADTFTGPTAGACSSVTTTSFNATWTNSTTINASTDRQVVRISTIKSEVLTGCPTSGACVVKADAQPMSLRNYTVSGLQPNTLYHIRVAALCNNSDHSQSYKEYVWNCTTATQTTPCANTLTEFCAVSGSVSGATAVSGKTCSISPNVCLACAAGSIKCGNNCVNNATNASNCGACGNACTGADTCIAGVCTAPGTACADSTTEFCAAFNAGTMTQVQKTCTAGACVNCKTNYVKCGTGTNAGCYATQTDSTHCGASCTACTDGKTCQAGVCACPSGQYFCGGACVASNDQHCGASCTACTSPKTCQADSCMCPSGRVTCQNTCCATGEICNSVTQTCGAQCAQQYCGADRKCNPACNGAPGCAADTDCVSPNVCWTTSPETLTCPGTCGATKTKMITLSYEGDTNTAVPVSYYKMCCEEGNMCAEIGNAPYFPTSAGGTNNARCYNTNEVVAPGGGTQQYICGLDPTNPSRWMKCGTGTQPSCASTTPACANNAAEFCVSSVNTATMTTVAGKTCTSGTTCINCKSPTTTKCGTGTSAICVDSNTNSDYCGASCTNCANQGKTCQNGVCVAAACGASGQAPCAGDLCNSNLANCNGVCRSFNECKGSSLWQASCGNHGGWACDNPASDLCGGALKACIGTTNGKDYTCWNDCTTAPGSGKNCDASTTTLFKYQAGGPKDAYTMNDAGSPTSGALWGNNAPNDGPVRVVNVDFATANCGVRGQCVSGSTSYPIGIVAGTSGRWVCAHVDGYATAFYSCSTSNDQRTIPTTQFKCDCSTSPCKFITQ